MDYLVVDFEFTFYKKSVGRPRTFFSEIIEIGAVIMKNGKEVDRFQTFVDPGRMLDKKIVELTGITDEMLNGAPQIETVLLNNGYSANYQIIIDRVKNTDTLDVQVEMTPEMFTDNIGEITNRQKALVEGLRNMLGISAKVTLVAPKTITRSEGKAVRVIDKRKI